jgi:hypothetical protein
MFASVIKPLTKSSWASATQDFSVWRNAGLQCFASAETAVTAALLYLAADIKRGKDVQLRHLFGQRLSDLENVIGPSGAFEDIGKPCLKSLCVFQEEVELRAILAHSVAKIAIDQDGEWVAILTHCSFKAKQPMKHKLVIDAQEAEIRLSKLKARTQSLCKHLENLTSKPLPS